MRSTLVIASLLIMPALAGAVSVNGVTIPQARIDEAVRSLQGQGLKDSPELRQNVTAKLVENELILQEAARRNLDKSPAFQAEVAAMRQEILGRMMLNEWVKANPVTDKEIEAEYNRIKPMLAGNEYQLRHILVKTEAEARALIEALNKGAKFDDLARKSLDTESGAKGGKLGWVRTDKAPPGVAEAIKALGKGQVSRAPVQGPSGWHVLKVDDVRAAKVPSLAELKSDISRRLQNQKIGAQVSELKAKAKIQQ